tara:strand:+ start:4939 stop:5139 length:201 start_codon:yes stop_codon:yes gene_type:complete
MARYVYQYINGASTNPPPIADWRLQIIDVEGTNFVSEGKIVYKSPVCKTKLECEAYKKEFDSNAGI